MSGLAKRLYLVTIRRWESDTPIAVLSARSEEQARERFYNKADIAKFEEERLDDIHDLEISVREISSDYEFIAG